MLRFQGRLELAGWRREGRAPPAARAARAEAPGRSQQEWRPRPERGGRRACGAASAAGPAASRGPLDGSASSRSQQELMERGGGKTGRSRRGGSAFAEITLLELPPRAKLLGAGGRRGARGAARLSRLQHVTDVERGQRDVSHSSCVTSVTSGVRFTCTAHLSVHRPHVEGSEATGGSVWLPNWTAWV